MGKFDFEDEEDNLPQGEPTFSLQDFKKWLSKQNKVNKENMTNESLEKPVRDEAKEKAEFKERVKKRRKKKGE